LCSFHENELALPPGLDPVRDVEEHLADGWTHEVEVHLDAPVEHAAHWVPRTLGRLDPADDGRCVLRGSTDDPRWYAAQLAAVELPFAVVGSEAVRTEVRALADRLTRAAE